MMDEIGDGVPLDERIARLEDSLGGASMLVAEFDGELSRMQRSLADANGTVTTLSSSLSRGLRRAFDGLVFDGLEASQALEAVGRSLVNATYSAALRPVTNRLGDLLGAGLASVGAAGRFADGAAFTQGRVRPFAKGGVVSAPTLFPMRGGTGLMGEAGPEAILPLERGADGALGVRSGGAGRPVQVVMNISTPDAASFQRSRGQIAAQMGRALATGARNR